MESLRVSGSEQLPDQLFLFPFSFHPSPSSLSAIITKRQSSENSSLVAREYIWYLVRFKVGLSGKTILASFFARSVKRYSSNRYYQRDYNYNFFFYRYDGIGSENKRNKRRNKFLKKLFQENQYPNLSNLIQKFINVSTLTFFISLKRS